LKTTKTCPWRKTCFRQQKTLSRIKNGGGRHINFIFGISFGNKNVLPQEFAFVNKNFCCGQKNLAVSKNLLSATNAFPAARKIRDHGKFFFRQQNRFLAKREILATTKNLLSATNTFLRPEKPETTAKFAFGSRIGSWQKREILATTRLMVNHPLVGEWP